ncbi:MAG: AAA family ATPase [Candidatus Binatia bacterium]
MQCASCGTELIPGKKFCHACGAQVVLTCPTCGAMVDPGFRFCPDCGSRITTGAPVAGSEAGQAGEGDSGGTTPARAADDRLRRLSTHMPEELARKILASKAASAGERKLVTVLFCDLVGSTAIAERLDPEEYHDLLEAYLEAAFQAIYQFEGIVNQLAGDGVMALFGAPLAHEDAPQRAVQAALAVRAALQRVNQRLGAERGIELCARFGINTGPVVVGTVGNDLKLDYTAIGDTTNLASRLQSVAEPGTILVSESTYRRVRDFVQLQPAGTFQVKGKSEPLVAYRVQGLREARAPMAIAAARGLTPLVGREAELAQLHACYQRVKEHLPQVVAVVGEAGSGKSRLLYEFRQQLAGTDVVLLEARCSSLSQALPYAPWINMMKQYFDLAPGETPSCSCDRIAEKIRPLDPQLRDIHPYLCRLLSIPLDSPADQSAEELRRETFEAMARLVAGLSARQPTLLIIEDLHWIDDSSREMLELAAERLQEGRVMLIVSHRPEYQPFWRTRAAFTQLRLRPLSDGDTTAVIRGVMDGALPAELEELIRVKAEGNPFFAEEISRALVEEGHVVRGNGRLRLARPVEQIRIPGTVEEVIAARLDRFDPQVKRLIQVAAVLGRQFRRDHLVRLVATEGIDVATGLDELERRGVIHRKTVLSRDEYRFGESLTREVAYGGLLLKERRQLHGRIGALLEVEDGEAGAELPALLAHHYARSDNREKAIETLLQAAGHAEQLPSYAAATRFYRQAWALADVAIAETTQLDGRLQRWAVAAAVGLCRMMVIYSSGDDVDAERAAQRAHELAATLGDKENMAALDTYRGMIMMGSGRERFADGLVLVEQGFAVARQAGLDLNAISISRGLARGYLFDGRFELARRTLAAAMDKLEGSEQRARLSDLYLGSRFMRDTASYFADDLSRALQDSTETYELAVHAGNRTVQSGSAATMALVYFVRGANTEAGQWAARSLKIAEEIGNAAAIRTASIVALGAQTELGEPAAAAPSMKLIEQGFVARGDMALKSLLAVEVMLLVGEVQRAQRFAEIARAHAGGRLREALCAAALGNAMRRLGSEHWNDAARWYEQAIGLAEAVGARSTLAAASLGAGELAAARGDRAVSVRYAQQALSLCRALGLRRYQLQADRLLANLHSGAERRA